MNITGLFERRSVLKAGAVLGGLSAVLARAPAAGAVERDGGEAVADDVKMAEIPRTEDFKEGRAAEAESRRPIYQGK